MKLRELISLYNTCRAMPPIEAGRYLAETIDSFLKDAEQIKDLILNAGKYVDGHEFREVYIKSLELFYLVSNVDQRVDTRDKILAFLSDIYDRIDSVLLQNAFVSHFESTVFGIGRECPEISKQLFDIMEYFSRTGLKKISRMKSSDDGKKNVGLIAVQQKLFNMQILFGDRYRPEAEGQLPYYRSMMKEIAMKDKYGEFASQIFTNEYFDVFHSFSLSLLKKSLKQSEIDKYMNFLESTSGLDKVLNYITGNNLPYELGCYAIIMTREAKALYSVFKTESFDAKHRLYALKALAQMDRAEEDLMSRITGEDVQSLLPAADAMIKEAAFTSPKNPFSNNIDTETVLVSMIFRASTFGNVDIIKSLKKMPTVMSFHAAGGYEIVEDSHGLLLLQDVNRKSTIHIKKLIGDLKRFIVGKEDVEPDYERMISEMKSHFALAE
ncbi:MAG: hypothetical protein LBK07_04380 [Tannerella sp.]|nr:hypothetical protein [Tannerella sp.]